MSSSGSISKTSRYHRTSVVYKVVMSFIARWMRLVQSDFCCCRRHSLIYVTSLFLMELYLMNLHRNPMNFHFHHHQASVLTSTNSD